MSQRKGSPTRASLEFSRSAKVGGRWHRACERAGMNPTAERRGSEVVSHYYNELVSYLKGSRTAVDGREAREEEASRLLRKTETLCERAIATLEEISGARFGGPTVGDKIADGLATASAGVAQWLSQVGEHTDSKALRDHYTALCGASCGFSMLYATEVGAFGPSANSERLLELMREFNQLIMEYGHVVPSVVLSELSREEGTPFTDFDKQSVVGEIQSTWKSQ